MATPLAIPFDTEERRTVFNLCLEIEQSIALRPDFAKFSDLDVRHSAILLQRYKIDSLEELRHTRKRNRDFITDDIRKNPIIDYSHCKMLLELFDSFPPINRNRGGGQPIEEISIPQQLAQYKIDFSAISGILRPDQNMVNAISEQISIAQSNALAYRPYIFLDLTRRPWVPPIIEHQRAIDSWKAALKNYSSPQPASIQQYLMYRLRFIFAADIARAFDSFGGAVAQFNNLGHILSLSITDSPALAIGYDQYLHNKLNCYARERTPGIDYFALLSEEQFEIKRYVSDSVLNKGKGRRRKERIRT